jgi:hypothetical protein
MARQQGGLLLLQCLCLAQRLLRLLLLRTRSTLHRLPLLVL